MNAMTPNPEQTVLDTEAYVRALTNQRNSALDAVAQLEGLVGTLRKEIVELKRQHPDHPLLEPTPPP